MDLKKRRKELGMTQADLAVQAGVTRQTVGKVENGKQCSLSTVKKLAAVLKMPVHCLLAGETLKILNWVMCYVFYRDQVLEDLERARGDFEVSRWLRGYSQFDCDTCEGSGLTSNALCDCITLNTPHFIIWPTYKYTDPGWTVLVVYVYNRDKGYTQDVRIRDLTSYLTEVIDVQ